MGSEIIVDAHFKENFHDNKLANKTINQERVQYSRGNIFPVRRVLVFMSVDHLFECRKKAFQEAV